MKNPIEHLFFRARVSPSFIAIQSLNKSYTFAELSFIVRACASKLRSLGVQSQQLVINHFKNAIFDLILTLSVFHEAAISCSIEADSSIDKDLESEWILTDSLAIEKGLSKNQVFIDAAWIDDALRKHKINAAHEYRNESICRLILTSGTTGKRKAVPLSYEMLDHRMRLSVMYWCTPGKEINCMALSTVGGIFSALVTVFLGGPIYFPGDRLVEFMKKFSITSVTGSPIQIASLIAQSNQSNISINFIQTVRVAGGAVSPLLLEKIRSQITTNVLNVYGSTEVGGITMSELNQNCVINSLAGYPLPNIDVQIVNDSNEILPQGQEGLVRARSSSMAHSYYKDQEASLKSFKDGWFFSGDRGFLNADGSLVLSGRNDELINRGGFKIDPLLIDQFFIDYPEIEDAAAFEIKNAMGIPDIGAALVVPENFDLKKLKQDLLGKFGKGGSPNKFYKLEKIPRNQMGKVMRFELTQKLSEKPVKVRASKEDETRNQNENG